MNGGFDNTGMRRGYVVILKHDDVRLRTTFQAIGPGPEYIPTSEPFEVDWTDPYWEGHWAEDWHPCTNLHEGQHVIIGNIPEDSPFWQYAPSDSVQAAPKKGDER